MVMRGLHQFCSDYVFVINIIRSMKRIAHAKRR